MFESREKKEKWNKLLVWDEKNNENWRIDWKTFNFDICDINWCSGINPIKEILSEKVKIAFDNSYLIHNNVVFWSKLR